MPKAKSKTTKRSSSARSNSGKGLNKRFGLTNKKVQFFVVIAIVALLGGGWFTYKSFAATPSNGFAWAGANLNCSGSCQKISDQSKNNAQVALLNTYNNPSSGLSTPSANASMNRRHKICVTGKGTGTVGVSGNTIIDKKEDYLTFNNSTAYETKCFTAVTKHQYGPSGNGGINDDYEKPGVILCPTDSCGLSVSAQPSTFVSISLVKMEISRAGTIK